MKKGMNKKGFTLIELLAVIIILAILMTLAITAMSGYIRGARRDTFVTTAQQYANAVRLSFVNGDYASDKMPTYGECLAVSTNKVALESGSHESPFNSDYSDESFVIIYNNSTAGADSYQYFVQMSDDANNGFGVLNENGLDGDLVKEQAVTAEGNYQTISTMTEGTSTINLYNATSNNTYEQLENAEGNPVSCTVSGIIQ